MGDPSYILDIAFQKYFYDNLEFKCNFHLQTNVNNHSLNRLFL
jgi:hypothetical protein